MNRSAADILQAEYLLARAKLLELAAIFDRLDRGQGSVDVHPQRKLLDKGLLIIQSDSPDRAEKLQLLMSRPYDPDWKQTLGVEA